MPLPEHADRRAVSDEVHARPYPLMRAPEQASHLAILSGEDVAEDHALLARLCALVGHRPPPPGVDHYAFEFDGTVEGPVRLRWERHTEFSTYTFFRPLAGDDPFAEPAIRAVPEAWVTGRSGLRQIVAPTRPPSRMRPMIVRSGRVPDRGGACKPRQF